MSSLEAVPINPLAELHRARGARWMNYQGCRVAAKYAGLHAEYRSLQRGAGLIDLSYRGRLRLEGDDRQKWLHGLVTQDVLGLADGCWAPAAALNPQGQMLTDLLILALPDCLLLDLPAATTGSFREHLDSYLFMEDVRIVDVRRETGLLSLQGPQSPLAVAACLGPQWAELPDHGVGVARWGESDVVVARLSQCGEDGFNLYVAREQLPALYSALYARARDFALQSVGWIALNHRRVEAGIPWWGHELDVKVVPFEARLEPLVSTTKGCYIGQEIVARLEARGQVNNLLCGLDLGEGKVPEVGAAVVCGERKVGRITSSQRSIGLGKGIALGYLRRELSACGSPVVVRGAGGREANATVVDLPFIPNGY